MPETPSTFDTRARWAGKVGEDTREGQDTHRFRSAQEPWQLLFREPGKQDSPRLRSESAAISPLNSAKEETMQAREAQVRVPRAMPVSAQPEGRYILLKKYEGFVTSKGERSFTARLFENSTDYPVLEAEFELEELSETDRGLAVEGAAMVWTIGYHYEGSTRKRESAIYFRRLPPWTEKEIEQARRNTEDLVRGIKWE
jgi:hypothetical protein